MKFCAALMIIDKDKCEPNRISLPQGGIILAVYRVLNEET